MNPDESQQPTNDDSAQPQVPADQPATFQIPPQESSQQPIAKHDNNSHREVPIFMREKNTVEPTQSPPPIVTAPGMTDESPPDISVPKASPTPDFSRQQSSSFTPNSQIPPTQNSTQEPVEPVTIMPAKIMPKRSARRGNFRLILLSVIGLAVVGLVIAAIVWFASLGGGDSTNSNSETREFESTILEFSTKIPDTWQDEQRREAGIDIVEFTHPELRDDNTPLASLFVVRLDLDEGQTAEEFFETFGSDLADGFDSFEKTSSEDIEIDGFSTKKISANVKEEGTEDKAVFYLMHGGDYGYIINQTVSEDEESEVSDDFAVIIDNFDVKSIDSESGE